MDEKINNLEINSLLGHYRIVKKIGAGGMGEVYLAQDTKLHRKVAFKVLPENIAADKERLRRFEQEARAASTLNHPNILTVYEFGFEQEIHFLATELIKGETLREKINDGELSLTDALNIAEQTAFALSAAHAAGIVHRDLKPENVMIRRDGIVKVLDFGLAKLIEKKEINPDAEAETRALVKTNPGVVMGTAAYMSPEQARGKETDARTDVWSLGVLIYEMTSGKLPFAGETMNDSIAAILTKEPPFLSHYVSDIPRDLERIVGKTLRKNRDERYQNIKDLQIDLKDLRQELEFQVKLERSAAPNKNRLETSGENRKMQILEAEPTGATEAAIPTKDAITHPSSSAEYVAREIKQHKRGIFAALSILLLAVIGIGYWFYAKRSASTDSKQINSIAVLPFVNESGNQDVEYLSDGMTETLISSLSQLPKLNVKARSSVFRYKGKDTNAQTIGKELNVQAILNGRVVQRGQDLTLYVELVDAATENSLWKQTYNKTMTNLVALQNDIARDVADKLKVKLSGADEQKLAKNYTANAEAYQLYLRGRYHLLKLTPSEIQTGILYFQQAIEIDSHYALAYAGLSEAYRSYAVAADLEPTEFLPKAKAAANKAIEIDDTLAEAHTVLGVAVFWGDWNWKEAENQYKRALELDPNSADAHMYYAHLLSITGRHTEALAEVKFARELEPLDLRINTLEAQFLIHAGRSDEALARLQETFKLDSNYWLAHSFAASAYIEKGMFAEAVAEARRARNLFDGGVQAIAFESYALAKSGKQVEARAVLEELLKLSAERYVPAYHVALVYNGLNERDKTLAWLERAFEQHNPRMVFLKVEPKWNNLRDEPRFQELLKKVGFPP